MKPLTPATLKAAAPIITVIAIALITITALLNGHDGTLTTSVVAVLAAAAGFQAHGVVSNPPPPKKPLNPPEPPR